jgi:hypothetical protein
MNMGVNGPPPSPITSIHQVDYEETYWIIRFFRWVLRRKRCRECGSWNTHQYTWYAQTPGGMIDKHARVFCHACDSDSGRDISRTLARFSASQPMSSPAPPPTGGSAAQPPERTRQSCGITPLSPGYAPCTREPGHDGPCAHHLIADGAAREIELAREGLTPMPAVIFSEDPPQLPRRRVRRSIE